MTNLLTLGILFSTAVRALVVDNLVILGISPFTSFILALRIGLAAKLVLSGTLSSMFFISALYTSFLTTSFLTTSCSLLVSTEIGTKISTSYLYTVPFKLVGTFLNLSISDLSTSDFKLVKSICLAKDDVSSLVALFKYIFVA